MSDNPYESPQSEPRLVVRSRRVVRLTGGTFLFVGLGLWLLVLGGSAIVSMTHEVTLSMNARFALIMGASLLALLGGALIIHGVLRAQSSIHLVAFLLAICVLYVVSVAVLNSL